MNKNYDLPEIKIILFQEEIVRTSSIFGNDESDDWGYDIWE